GLRLPVTGACSSDRQRAPPRQRCKNAPRGARSGLVLSSREETVDREEAIRWLRSQGVNASKRDWALGASIVIRVGPSEVRVGPPEESSGITVYRNVFYLYPGPNGSWEFLNCADNRTSRYPDLQLAVQAALDTVAGPQPL